jgi:hypothetical protein
MTGFDFGPFVHAENLEILRRDLAAGMHTATIATEYGWDPKEVNQAAVKLNGQRPDDQDTAKPEPYHLVGRDGLDKLPAVEPLIDGVLDRRGLAVIAGYRGCGKSFVMLSMLLAVSTGASWLGRDTCRAGPVLYVVGEGLHGLRSRVEAWEYAWHVRASGLHVLHEPLSLVDPRAVDRVLLTVDNLKPVTVAFDTLSRAMSGADENSAKDMSLAVQTLTRVAEVCDGLTAAVHHTGKNGDLRGSSALDGGADRIWMCEGDTGLLTLTASKTKDGAEPSPLRLHMRPVLDSLVPELVTFPQETVASRHATRARAVALVSQLCGSVPLPRTPLRDALIEDLNVSASQVYRLINTLVTDDVLRNVGTSRAPLYLAVTVP